MANKIIIIDFGSQTCHLIGRRIKDLGIETEIIEPNSSVEIIKKEKPKGIIFSGGPSSVYEKNAPTVSKEIFDLKIPILGICYGQQLITHLLNGKVLSGKKKEYGPAKIAVDQTISLFSQLPKEFVVWMSHGDEVKILPKDFISIAKTGNILNAAIVDLKRNIFGLQFHPEVDHTEYGAEILNNFVKKVCGLEIRKKEIDIQEIVKKIREEINGKKVICAVSGGVDSTVAAVLIAKAIGNNLYPVYVESGLMRLGTKEEVVGIFRNLLKIEPIIIEAKEFFLKSLKGIIDPEEKRKTIGHLYIKLFLREAKKNKGVKFLGQGTIYSDVIESKGTKNADKIKSHHNVGGLPKNLGLKLIEPLRFFYKDEVKIIAQKLNLPKSIVYKQPFPGPGSAIRIIGEITKERLDKQLIIDKIILEELKKADYLKKIFQSFPVMTGVKSTAVVGDNRFYGEVVALRIYESKDIMTSNWSKVPYSLLQKISSRIVNEIPGISRVVYDITTKPPATMEWE